METPKVGAAPVHAHVGDHHAVAVSLRVLLVEDTSGWFAQGLDIDYAASGQSVDAVKKNFEDGFCATVHEHLVMHGNIERLLKPADQSAWKEFYAESATGLEFSCIQLHNTAHDDCGGPASNLPFSTIQFMHKAPLGKLTSELIRA